MASPVVDPEVPAPLSPRELERRVSDASAGSPRPAAAAAAASPRAAAVLQVDGPPAAPALVAVDARSMSVQWEPNPVTLRSAERSAERERLPAPIEYSLTYELQMQQVDDAAAPGGAAPPHPDRWSAQYVGPVTYVQVKGLRPGRRYAVRVLCRPAVGDPGVEVVQFAGEPPVLEVATPPAAPGPPAPPAAAGRQRGALRLRWAPPDDGGGLPVQAYVLEVAPPPEGWAPPRRGAQQYAQYERHAGGAAWAEVYRGPEAQATVRRLEPGRRYAARVRAVSAAGEGAWSAPAEAATAPGPPGAPAAPELVAAGDASVAVRWAPPADDGGSPVLGYAAEMDDGLGAGYVPIYAGPATYLTVDRLLPGVRYRIRVRADNAEGRGAWGPPAEAAAVSGAPGPPGAPAPVGPPARGAAALRWRPPAPGGCPVEEYQLEMRPRCAGARAAIGGGQGAGAGGAGDDWLLVYRGAEPSCTLGALRAGCEYALRVRGASAEGVGPYSAEGGVATAPDAPDAPAPPAAAARLQAALRLSWAPPPHDGGAPVAGYRLEMCRVGRVEGDDARAAAGGGKGKGEGGVEPEWEVRYAGPACAAEVAGLEPGCRYQFRLQAANALGASPWAGPATVETRPAPPLAPARPAVGAAAAAAVRLSWARPYGQGGGVTSYAVQVAEAGAGGAAAGGDGAWRTAYTGPAPACAVGGLAPATAYLLRVRAANGAGAGPWSEPARARTAAAPPAPPAPPALAAPPGARALALSWAPPPADHGARVSGYQLEVARAPRGSAPPSWAPAHAGPPEPRAAAVAGLRPGAAYLARVRAGNACGWGAWSAPLRAATAAAPPAAPEGLRVSGRGAAGGARARWGPPADDGGAPVVAYELHAARGGGAYAAVYRGGEPSCRLPDLEPGAEHAFRVRAVSAAGAGEWSAAATLLAALAPPAAPTGVRARPAGGGAAAVAWAPPPLAAGRAACVGYEVEAAPVRAAEAAAAAGAAGARAARPPAAVRHTCKAAEAALAGLQPGAAYAVRVRAVGADGAGHGEWSAPGAVELPAAPPPPPPGPVQLAVAAPAAAAPAAPPPPPKAHRPALLATKVVTAKRPSRPSLRRLLHKRLHHAARQYAQNKVVYTVYLVAFVVAAAVCYVSLWPRVWSSVLALRG